MKPPTCNILPVIFNDPTLNTIIYSFLIVIIVYLAIYWITYCSIGSSVVITRLLKRAPHRRDLEIKVIPEKLEIDPKAKPKDIAIKAHAVAMNAVEIANQIKSDPESIADVKPYTLRNKKAKNKDTVSNAVQTDATYFLPTASITIVGTATVTTYSSAENGVEKAVLTGLSLSNTVVIEPDTTQLLALKYNSFPFANDELRLTTNSSGLLENIASTTEDRISNIIAEISQAPADIAKSAAPMMSFAMEKIGEAPDEQTGTDGLLTATITYTQTFYILPEDLRHSPIIRSWMLIIDGSKNNVRVDASFKLEFNAEITDPISENTDYEGILTRPLRRIKLQLFIKEQVPGEIGKDFQDSRSATYEEFIPDTSLLLNIPVERTAFVKKINQPKFANGLLVENYISKPSQVEGALSIPINVLKAVASIPAQLLNFKITHTQQETSLLNVQQSLVKAQLLAQSTANATQMNTLKQTAMDSQQALFNATQGMTATQQGIDSSKNSLQSVLQKASAATNAAIQTQNSVLYTVLAKLTPQIQLQMPGYAGFDINQLTGVAGLKFDSAHPPTDENLSWLDQNIGKGNYQIVTSNISA